MAFKVPEQFRETTGSMGTPNGCGNYGVFGIKLKMGQKLIAIASDGAGWEHVSISRRDRCPTWEEMCQVKDLFWDAEDMVMQLHPPKSQWISNHPYCLHLWRPIDQVIPSPPGIMVGILGLEVRK